MEKLEEKMQAIVETKTAKPIRESDKHLFKTLVKNELDYLTEQTFRGDLAALGQILVPVFRRAFPQLIGKDIIGVQPMTQPTGYAFALRYHYVGNTTGNATLSGVTPVGGSEHTTPYQTSFHKPSADVQRTALNTVILIYTDEATRLIDCPNVGYGVAPAAATGSLATVANTMIIYSEENKAVVFNATNIAGVKALVGQTGGAVDWYDNIAGFLYILKSYPGPLSVLTGEKLGYDMEEIGLSIDKLPVEAKTRKLKSRYTLEAAQDMKAIHGKDMATELIDILTHEVSMSIDRDIIGTINSLAPVTTVNVDTLDGRWQSEKHRVAYTTLVRRSNDIAKTTLRGPGNIIIASADAVTMFEQLPGFNLAPIQAAVNSGEPVSTLGQSMVGTMGGRFNVYRDNFADVDYATVGYKGPSNYDTGVVWCPYIPLEMKKTIDPENGNPNIIFLERSAIAANIFGGQNYYRRVVYTNIFTTTPTQFVS
jgi:hypothetical protein